MPSGETTSNQGTRASNQGKEPSVPSNERLLWIGTVEKAEPFQEGVTSGSRLPNRCTITVGKTDHDHPKLIYFVEGIGFKFFEGKSFEYTVGRKEDDDLELLGLQKPFSRFRAGRR